MKDNIAAATIGDKHDRIWRMMFLLDELLRISMPVMVYIGFPSTLRPSVSPFLPLFYLFPLLFSVQSGCPSRNRPKPKKIYAKLIFVSLKN
jgi:hypothetical protein